MNVKQLDFLNQVWMGNSLWEFLRFGIILVLALLLKRYISGLFAKMFFAFFKRFSKDYFVQQFKELVQIPIEGILVSVLFYIAFLQISTFWDKLVLFKRMKPGEGKKTIGFEATALDLIEHVFFLFLLFYIVLLAVRIIQFVFMVFMHKAQEEKDRERLQVLPLLRDVLKGIVWVFGVLSVLGVVFHVNVAALIAGMGVGGIAIAFAAKESLENLLASFMVMIDKPFTIGDWIKVGDVEGNIEKVGFRSTRIRTFDKSVVAMPNRQVMDNNVENFTERGSRRVSLTVGAVYGLSQGRLELVMGKIKEQIAAVAGTVGNVSVTLHGFGDSSVNIQIVYFVATDAQVDYAQVTQTVNFIIYNNMYRYAKGFAYPTQLAIEGEDIDEVTASDAAKELN
ncbi:MAG: mechanosensitive ion channel family protein [Edaphocola sp.]